MTARKNRVGLYWGILPLIVLLITMIGSAPAWAEDDSSAKIFTEAAENWGQPGYARRSAFSNMEILAYESYVPALKELVRRYTLGDGLEKDGARAYFWSVHLMEEIGAAPSVISSYSTTQATTQATAQERDLANTWLAKDLPYPPTIKGTVPDIEFDTRMALEKAAKGDPLKIVKIMDMYHRGLLLRQDLAKAYYWLIRLEQMHLGLDDVKKDLLSKISDEQLNLASQWLSDGAVPPR